MISLETTQLIERPLAQVFAICSDASTTPEWDPPVKAVLQAPEFPLKVGAVVVLMVSGYGEQTLDLKEYEHERVSFWALKARWFSGGHRMVFSAEGDATRVEREFSIQPLRAMRLLTPYLSVMVRRSIARSLAGLKAYCESQPR